jgi:ubiquitin-protein ligase
MSTVRLRRLQADYEKVRDYVTRHPRLQLIQVQGNPPERYQIEYRVNSLRQKEDGLEEVSSHLVEVFLPLNYPRIPPACRMLTPVFHPNIAPHAICIGDHWSAGESLSALLARIGEMLAYQSYNTKSPLNGEAARWTDQNLARLPLDKVSMTVEEPVAAGAPGTPGMAAPAASAARPVKVTMPPPTGPTVAPAAPSPSPVSPVAAPAFTSAASHVLVTCPSCTAKLRLPAEARGRRVRCPKCQCAFQAVA